MTFFGGELTVHDVNASTGEVTDDRGVYCVEHGRVSLGLLGQPPECGDFWSAGWTLEGDQLRFTDVQSHHGFDLLIANAVRRAAVHEDRIAVRLVTPVHMCWRQNGANLRWCPASK